MINESEYLRKQLRGTVMPPRTFDFVCGVMNSYTSDTLQETKQKHADEVDGLKQEITRLKGWRTQKRIK